MKQAAQIEDHPPDGGATSVASTTHRGTRLEVEETDPPCLHPLRTEICP